MPPALLCWPWDLHESERDPKHLLRRRLQRAISHARAPPADLALQQAGHPEGHARRRSGVYLLVGCFPSSEQFRSLAKPELYLLHWMEFLLDSMIQFWG